VHSLCGPTISRLLSTECQCRNYWQHFEWVSEWLNTWLIHFSCYRTVKDFRMSACPYVCLFVCHITRQYCSPTVRYTILLFLTLVNILRNSDEINFNCNLIRCDRFATLQAISRCLYETIESIDIDRCSMFIFIMKQ